MKAEISFVILILLSNISCEKKSQVPDNLFDDNRYSEVFTGGEYSLGPLDWEETYCTNSFGPYPDLIQTVEGRHLARVGQEHSINGEICDACVKIITGKGKSLIARVVTTGSDTNNNIDLSTIAYNLLNSRESPRNVSWYITKCPPNDHNIIFQVKEGSDQLWTGFWIRNASLPVSKVEVKKENYNFWSELKREEDGSFVAENGLGETFSMRITAIDGSIIGFSKDGPILVPEVFFEPNIQF